MTEGTFSFGYEWLTDDVMIILIVEGYIRDGEVFDLHAYRPDGSEVEPMPATLDEELVDHLWSEVL